MNSETYDFINPDKLRSKLLHASLYLTFHEMLKNLIIRRIHEFYSGTWTEEKGWETSQRYTDSVLSLDPKKKYDSFRASIEWLVNEGIISKEDKDDIRALTNERNKIAHELLKVIGSQVEIDLHDITSRVVAIAVKIENWWIINVEAGTDPEYAGLDLDATNVTSGTEIIFRILSQVAVGNDEEAWAIHKHFNDATNR